MDPYRELHISPDATEEEIKSAYRKLAKQYHPDAHPKEDDAPEKMNRINAAYHMLLRGDSYYDDAKDWENWFTEEAEETAGRRSIFANPLFKRVTVIVIVISMIAVGIISAFFSALWADTVHVPAQIQACADSDFRLSGQPRSDMNPGILRPTTTQHLELRWYE